MKLIWITGECPYPANTGGRIGVWKRIVQHSRNNDIILYSIFDKEEEKINKGIISKYCREVHFFPREKEKLLFFLKCLFVPFPVASRRSESMIKEIDFQCRTEKVDYVIVESPTMAVELSNYVMTTQKIILNQHNIEYLTMKSLSKSFRNPLKKKLYAIVAKQMEQYEKRLYRKNFVKLYTFVSSSDMAFFSQTYDKTNTYLLPVGADVEILPTENNEKNIMVIGKMSYPPNIEGIIWFLNNCWDQILQNVPGVKLFVVGKEPDEEVIKVCNRRPGVHVTGTVPSVKEYYQKASLIIVPLLNGGGVKVKLLEALGYGKLVISTSKGVEGTDFKRNKHLIVEDEPEQFANYCIDMLNNPEHYEPIRQMAIEKMQKEYSWESIVGHFEDYLHNELDKQ